MVIWFMIYIWFALTGKISHLTITSILSLHPAVELNMNQAAQRK